MEWDEQVLEWLRAKAEELDGSGVARLFKDVVGRSWRRNAESYDEGAGDTPRSLGVNQSENLRELMLREYRDHQDHWAAQGSRCRTLSSRCWSAPQVWRCTR